MDKGPPIAGHSVPFHLGHVVLGRLLFARWRRGVVSIQFQCPVIVGRGLGIGSAVVQRLLFIIVLKAVYGPRPKRTVIASLSCGHGRTAIWSFDLHKEVRRKRLILHG